LTVSPFRYRPNPDTDVDADGNIPDWEDNALSNFLAWGSVTFTPTWCQNDKHWSARLANSLFTTCPCCMVFRGIFVGLTISSILWILIISLLLVSVAS